MPETTHTGGCHCGQVRYSATLDLGEVIACNCSICTKHGLILGFTPPEKFRLDSGEGEQSVYRFNKHVVDHTFCPQCGVESFARGKLPDGRAMIAVNVRCLDNVELGMLKPKPVDGRKF